MKAVIIAGGLGTHLAEARQLSETTDTQPIRNYVLTGGYIRNAKTFALGDL